MQDNPRYDYSQAGFGPYLTRSIDEGSQGALGEGGSATSRAVAFDRQQVSGSIGDTLQLGRIHLNGANGNITLDDGEVTRFLIGEDKDGF